MTHLFLKVILKILPWLVLILLFYFLLANYTGWPFGETEEPKTEISNTTILTKIEALGKLELVKYNFQEITELTEKNSKFLGIFPSGDSKAVLISQGEAVGCIDLTQISARDILVKGDSFIIKLPAPELCYYKLNMEKTRIYSIEKGVYYKDEREMIQKAYRVAERQIKEAALESGILEKTEENAEIILQPFLEEVTKKKVYFSRSMKQENIRIKSR